ncbi:MAG TPA: DUF4157 domain-containing protein [Chitinophaga sp.]|uniref:eCIS core domain-containing protein n=1 Tax=Chitinophaga sp. TaxID=1869181 RepID=UPI002DB6FF22|nr:DUF4157 domain-containing protein [Chitinophaga sp.]HEU4554859.1 DUF4157 domain-containing protein [Chitinophaga sp.]
MFTYSSSDHSYSSRAAASEPTALPAVPGAPLQKNAANMDELVQGKFVTQLQPEEEEKLPAQGKFVIQKAPLKEEEKPLQGKFTVQRKANNTGMPDNLKSGIENLSGMDMSDVKVHYNSSQPAQLNALAYAQGSNIHIGPGQEKHLPHEAWHVVQQRQGRVQATTQLKESVPVNDDPGLEHEADVMGAKAMNA